jgi:ribonuclease HI
MNALAWVKKKKCNTKLMHTAVNEPIFDLIDRAENWLATHSWSIPLYKWKTSSWGEIPADFGRK